MFGRGKESGDYLSQLSNNIDEKTLLIAREYKKGEIPKAPDGHVNVIELGIGGGESLKEVKQLTADNEEVRLTAVDILPELAASVKRQTQVEAVAADGGRMPFKNESISAINASAVYHELASYGVTTPEGRKVGTEAIEEALSETNRVLVPDGMLAYRDVLVPTHDKDEIKTVHYKPDSWKEFYKWFSSSLTGGEPHPLDQDHIQVDEDNADLAIIASAAQHRELQRHYITFRDYLRNVIPETMGVWIKRSEWHDKSQGIKTMVIEVASDFLDVIEKYVAKKHASMKGNVYEMMSDDFDRFYDDVIARRFSDEKGDDNSFAEAIEKWKQREGAESYIHANISEMLLSAVKASLRGQEGEDDPYILFPANAESILVTPRDYYRTYLHDVIDDPEQDGKQLIAFRKMKLSSALEVLNNLRHSIDENIVGPDTFDKLEKIMTKD